MKRTSAFFLVLFFIFTAQMFAYRYTIFSQFASGGGWSSELFFTNQGLKMIPGITVSFYNPSGDAIPVDTNLGTSTAFGFTLAPGATQVIKITPGTTTATGYAMVYYPIPYAPVRATLVYRYEQGGVVQAEVGVPQLEQGEHFSFAAEVDSSKGINTALGLANPTAYYGSSPTAATMIISLIRTDGTIQATAKVPLKAGQQISKYLTELFPGLDGFTGTVSVSSPMGVGVVALRQDRQAFGAIATDSGPVVGAFMLNKTPIQEVEPNNGTSTAMLIASSTIFSGNVSTDDLDVFKIVGQKGDIITVICDTRDLSSRLDSVLILTNSAGALIAGNDQSGVYGTNDSFLRAELPADGTYYVVLGDPYTGGGSTYQYNLHIVLP
jgi:hypothetical protein